MKKNTVLVLFQRSGAVVLFPLVLAASLGLGGCKNDITGPEMKPPVSAPETPGEEAGWSNWSEWSWGAWINDGNEVEGPLSWDDWKTTKEATATTTGDGEREAYKIFKQPQKRTGTRTRTVDDAGTSTPGGAGAGAGVETQTETSTETQNVERREPVPGENVYCQIPKGKKLNPDGTFSNLEIEGTPDKTVPAHAAVADVDVVDIFINYNNGASTAGLFNTVAVPILSDSIQGLIDQADDLKTWLNDAAGDNDGNGLDVIFANLATAQGGINKGAATSAVNFATTMDTQIGNMVTAIFGASGTDRDMFDKWLTAYVQSKTLVTRDFVIDGKDTVDGCVPTLRGALQDTDVDKGNLLIGIYGNYRGGNINDFNNKDNLLNALETGLTNQITAKFGVTDSNATALAKALVTQFGDRAEFAAIIQDLTKADDQMGYDDYTNALEVFNYSPYMTQAQTQSSNIRLAHVGDGFEFSHDLIKGAGGVEYTGNYTPVGRKNDGVGMA
jgi:hypothetical protein